MGVDVNRFKPVDNATYEKIKMLTVARLTEKKGHCFALKAIKEAIGAIPQLEYHIAGSGPLLTEIQRLTRELGLENHVIFHGEVNGSEVLNLYHRSHMFLLPSVTSSKGDMEGIPVALMEAMACGLPVIASMHSGIPELVINGQTGYTSPEKEPVVIAERVICLAKNIELGRKLGNQAREHVKRHFSNPTLVKQLLAIFHKFCCTGNSD